METGNDSVAFLDRCDFRPDLIDYAHELMSQDFAFLQLHNLLVVQVQITTADCRAGHLHDGIGRLGYGRCGHFFNADIPITVPAECKHGFTGTSIILVRGSGRSVTELFFRLVGDDRIHDAIENDGVPDFFRKKIKLEQRLLANNGKTVTDTGRKSGRFIQPGIPCHQKRHVAWPAMMTQRSIEGYYLV